MKKISWILILLVLFFTGDRSSAWVLDKLTLASQFRYPRLYKGDAAADILLVGNSRGLVFYQPYIEKITGHSTFNLSYNGMPINLAQTLIKDYLEKYPAPKKLLLEVTLADRENLALIDDFKLFTKYSKNLTSLLQESNPTFLKASQVSHLFRYNSQVFQRSLYHLQKTDTTWLLDRLISNYLQETVQDHPPYLIDVDDKRVAEIKQTVELVKSHGVEVQLIINPYYPAFTKRITNMTTLKSNVEKATGLDVLDYSVAINDVACFADYQHLNLKGARAFVDLLIKDDVFEMPLSQKK